MQQKTFHKILRRIHLSNIDPEDLWVERQLKASLDGDFQYFLSQFRLSGGDSKNKALSRALHACRKTEDAYELYRYARKDEHRIQIFLKIAEIMERYK